MILLGIAKPAPDFTPFGPHLRSYHCQHFASFHSSAALHCYTILLKFQPTLKKCSDCITINIFYFKNYSLFKKHAGRF